MPVFETRQFGKYQLLDQIAKGGMAELYRAKLTGVQGFEKLIALKKILPHLSDEDNLVKAFIDEAKLAALLHHENIIQIYDFGNLDGEYFIAMEYLFGKDLRTIIRMAAERKQPMGMENILYIVSRICAGLDYSHNLKDLHGKALNIIHRDINPQNIFITYEGQVKIIDFGIAKAANHNTKTKENLIKGKLAYMSPEQANGLSIDHRSDIFSSGIVLYELLADRRMFEGETLHVLSLVQEARFDPPEQAIADLPPKLSDILNRALAKEPLDRYQSCGEMLADLEECAFELSLRPNGRNFAAFMKALFEEEFAEEELALWAKTRIYEAADSDTEDTSSKAEDLDGDTALLTKTFFWAKLKRLSYKPIALGVWLAKLKRLNYPHVGLGGWPAKLKGLNYKHVAVVLWLALLAVLVDFGLKQIPLPKSSEEGSIAAVQTTSSTKPAAFDKLAAAQDALESKRYAQAADIYKEVLTVEPALLERVAQSYVKALQGQAADLMQAEPQRAQELLLKALEISPDDITVLSQLGYSYVGQKNYPKAIGIYKKVAELNPRLPDAFFNLGYVYAITKDYPQAQAMYRRVVELAPAFMDEALFNLAVIQEKMGQRDRCIKSLEQAVSLNPGNESAKHYLQKLKAQTGDEG